MNRRNSGNNDGWEVSKINDSHQVIENTRHDTSGKKKKAYTQEKEYSTGKGGYYLIMQVCMWCIPQRFNENQSGF